MECTLVAPHGADIGKVEEEYPDICADELDEDGDVYFIGKPSDEERDDEWLTHDEAIAFCGFAEGAIEGANAVIDGNGGWAMGMLRRQDFSGLAVDEETKTEYTRRSNIWHSAYQRGLKQR